MDAGRGGRVTGSSSESATRILVIDDEELVRKLVVEILARAGYDSTGAETPARALELIDDPDLALVISDILMPGLTGFELLEEVRTRRPSLPVLLVSGAGTEANLTEALARGAAGLIAKPFSHKELVHTVEAVLERARRSEREVRERLLAPTLTSALANAIEARDSGTGGHTERLAGLALCLASRLGLSRAELETIRLGAVLHDIGKIGIPDRVLLKPGPLSEDEFALMRTHTLIGDRLLEPLDALAVARPIVRHHHERWDGAGYPDGLGGETIPLAARIVSLADAVEAMSARRPYRDPLDIASIVHEIERGRGTQWDPAIADLALELIERGEIFFDNDGVWHAERGTRKERHGLSLQEVEQLLPELLHQLAILNRELDRHVVSVDDARAWVESSAEDGVAHRRLEALAAIETLKRYLGTAGNRELSGSKSHRKS